MVVARLTIGRSDSLTLAQRIRQRSSEHDSPVVENLVGRQVAAFALFEHTRLEASTGLWDLHPCSEVKQRSAARATLSLHDLDGGGPRISRKGCAADRERGGSCA